MKRSKRSPARARTRVTTATAASVALLLLGGACCSSQKTPVPLRPGLVQLSIGGKPRAWVELALKPAAQARGLMDRSSLEPDCGMLFVFPEEKPQSFWMKNCLIPLDIAYLGPGGEIIEILRMEVEPPGTIEYRHYRSSRPCRFALEMAAGWFAAQKIVPGDRFDPFHPYWPMEEP